MFSRILALFLVFSCAASANANAENAQEKELKAKIKQYCGDHKKYVEKGGSKSECQNSENGALAHKMNILAQESMKVCADTAKFFVTTKAEFQNIVQQGTSNAEQLKAEVASKNLNMNELHQLQEQGIRDLYARTQETSVRIRNSYESHHERHDVLSSLEKTYEKLKDQIGHQHDEQECSGRERKWYAVEAYHLEEEMETLRETVAENMQELTKLYQKNLVALGASKAQALTLARDLVNAKSMGSAALPTPEGVLLESPNEIKVRNDGLLEGADRGTLVDKLDRSFGRNRPYEKEWREVPCPAGSEAPGCWERGYKAKGSSIDDAALAAFSGTLSAGESQSNISSQNPSAGSSAISAALGAQEEAEAMASLRRTLDEQSREYPDPFSEEEAAKLRREVEIAAGLRPAEEPQEVTKEEKREGPQVALAKPSVLPGHGPNEVSRAGIDQFYTKAGGARFTEQDGKRIDDGFSDLYVHGRNATYMHTQGEVNYTGQAAKSPEVRTLQGNINEVLKEAGYRQAIVADGVYGAQTQSALDFIGKDPELRSKLLRRQGRAPANQ